MLRLILFSATVTPGTIVGTPINKDHCLIKQTVYISRHYNYVSTYSHNIMGITRLWHGCFNLV